jgi:hypothetical protein
VAVFPVGDEGMTVVNEPYGEELLSQIQSLKNVDPLKIDSFPPGFIPDEVPSLEDTQGRRYAASSALYAPRGFGDRYHMQVWLWDVETPTLVYTDELVCDDLEDAQVYMPFMVEWIFSNVPKEEE